MTCVYDKDHIIAPRINRNFRFRGFVWIEKEVFIPRLVLVSAASTGDRSPSLQ